LEKGAFMDTFRVKPQDKDMRLAGDHGGKIGCSFKKRINGYPVVDEFRGMKLSVDMDGTLLNMTQRWDYSPVVAERPRITRTRALSIAQGFARKPSTTVNAKDLEIKLGYARTGKVQGKANLVWSVQFDPGQLHYYVDAVNGRIIKDYEALRPNE
jgi:hypothetical protein